MSRITEMFFPGIGAIVLAVIFLAGSFFWGNINGGKLQIDSPPQMNEVSNPASVALPIPEPGSDLVKMKQDVQEIVDGNEGDIGVAFKDLESNETWGINEDKVFTAASTMKVVAVSGLYDAFERGKVDLKKSVGGADLREHARLALEVSDNNSWEIISNTVGYKNLQSYALEMGMENTDLFANTITPEDFRIVLEKLYRGQLLDGENTAEVLSFMDKTETENRIPTGAGEAEVIYHKTGTLDALTHDGGIIKSGNGDYILTVYTEFLDGNVDDRSSVIALISEVVWNDYTKRSE